MYLHINKLFFFMSFMSVFPYVHTVYAADLQQTARAQFYGWVKWEIASIFTKPQH